MAPTRPGWGPLEGTQTRTYALQGRVDGAPGTHASFAQPLPDGKFQVQQGDALHDQQDEEWNHECSWGQRAAGRQAAAHGQRKGHRCW